MGRDWKRLGKLTSWQMFQFTRPHGARLQFRQILARNTYCFNSRARMGRDIIALGYGHFLQLFQFTRPHGARLVAFDPGRAI